MAVYKCDDETYVISANEMWLPGCYEDERTAKYAFRVTDQVKADLRDAAIARGDGVITWGDIARARDALK